MDPDKAPESKDSKGLKAGSEEEHKPPYWLIRCCRMQEQAESDKRNLKAKIAA